MEEIARSFLNFMQIPPATRYHTGELLGQLRRKLEGYSTSRDKDIAVETSAAENLMKCLWCERVALSSANTREYVKVLRILWEYEDQGYLTSSSCINDLGIRALLETYQDIGTGSFVISALQHMFVTATKQNKRGLVLLFVCSCNASHVVIFDLWEHAIVGSIGKSSMRMEVVKSSLQDNCVNDFLISKNAENLLKCIISTSSSIFFDWRTLLSTLIEKIHRSDEKTAIIYVRFVHALAKFEEDDPKYYINEFISLLKTMKRPSIDLQAVIHEVIADVKRRRSINVYQEILWNIFSENWETKGRK